MPRVVVFDEIGPPDVLHIVEEPVPEPADGEVRVKIQAFGVNPVEQMMRTGAYPAPFRLPHARIGLEGTGLIDAVGPGVEEFSIGDPVILAAVPRMDLNGTYAEYTTVPVSAVVARPAGLDVVGAAALWAVYSTAYGALIEKAAMHPGDRVLIQSASSNVGLAAIQIANQIGAVPIAVTRRSAKREALLAAGAHQVIATDEDDLLKSVAGVDIILDTVRGPGFAELAAAVKLGGTVISVGWSDPRPPTYPSAPVTFINYMSFEHTLNPVTVRRIAAFLGAGLRTGALRPTIDQVFRFDDVVAAHEYLEKGQYLGKIVVTL